MSRLSERIVAGLLLLFILVYTAYQAYRYFASPLRLETVFQYTVSNTVVAPGIAMRDEIVLDQQVSGIEHYLFEDAARVATGEVVAEFYTSNVSDKNIRRITEIENEINMLTEAQDTTVNNYANADILGRDIKEQMGYLAEMASLGRFDEARNIRPELVALINKKQVATGKATSFAARIAQLQKEYGQLEPQASRDNVTTATAPASGYFAKKVDGYESKLSPTKRDNLTIDAYKRLIATPIPAVTSHKVGKLVMSQNWVFAATLPKYSAEWLRAGQSVSLQFELINERIPAIVSEIMQEKDNDNVIILLACDYISEELISLRTSNVTISYQQFNGLRINTADLRFANWVFEATIPKDGIEWMRAGQRVSVQLENAVQPVSATVRTITDETGSDSAVVLLSCDEEAEAHISQDAAAATVIFQPDSESPNAEPPPPLRADTASLRFVGKERGVYILDNNKVKFKTIDPIYEEAAFVLSKLNYAELFSEKNDVCLFQQVITKGNDLYNGKVVR